MKVYQAKDGFLWGDVTAMAKSLWQAQDFEQVVNWTKHLNYIL